MRLDPKFFNKFIAICAIITFIAIIFFTIRHSQSQVRDFKSNIENVQPDTLSFYSYSMPDSLYLSELKGGPAVIQFWSTWSGRSHGVNLILEEFKAHFPEMTVLAAVVRDDETLVREYIANHSFPFHFVDGTDLFHNVYAPGVPSQIFINSEGQLADFHIGDNEKAVRDKLNQLLQNE